MNRLVRPVMFAFEPDLVQVFARATFGAAGAPTLDTNNSKGVCAWNKVSQVWTATTTNTSASVTAAQSLFGVYNGMTVTGTGIPASTTVSAVNPGAGTLTLSNVATASGTVPLTFSGGQYQIQFGSQATPFLRLDTYVKLLQMTRLWDEVTNAVGNAAATPSAGLAPHVFLVESTIAYSNQTFTRTGTTDGSTGAITAVTPSIGGIIPGMAVTGAGIPASSIVVSASGTTVTINQNTTSATANETLTFTPLYPASVIIQCGSLSGATFTAANPASGELLRLGFSLSRSNAI